MAFANDAIVVTPGSGATIACQAPGGSRTTEYQVVVLANATGHLADSMPTYGLNIPQITLATDSYPWEFFNHPSSGKTVTLRGLWPSPDLANGNNVIRPERWMFFRTTAESSGGTAASLESSTTLRANFFRLNPNDASLSSHISCKTVLTSITTGTSLGYRHLSSYATSLMVDNRYESTLWNQLTQAINIIPQREFGQELTIPPGQGLTVRQGSVAGSGAMGWLLEFTVSP